MAYTWSVVGGKRRPDTVWSEVMNVDAVTCAFCRGWGRDRSWSHSRCQVYGSSGQVRVRPPIQRCDRCGGTGHNRSNRLYCIECRGSGVVRAITSLTR